MAKKPESFLHGAVILHCGDCLEVLQSLPANSIDSCVTDPPYHLVSIVQRFGSENAAPAKQGKDGRFKRASAGFMGQKWDGGDIAFKPDVWKQVFRVLKPGGYLLACGGTRTYHRMACAIEDAGFEVRDTIMWLYGSGFPKSHDISKAIDRAAGAEREVVGFDSHKAERFKSGLESQNNGWDRPWMHEPDAVEKRGNITAPATDAAREWQGWGTALKPAVEPIVMARKLLSEKTVAANVVKWGTGAINVDGCRVEHDEACNPIRAQDVSKRDERIIRQAIRDKDTLNLKPSGRWPANVIHDGSDEVTEGFPESVSTGGDGYKESMFCGGKPTGGHGLGDSGSAARFFYTAKADSDDRIASKHPTVKPVDLIQYLIRLVTPPRGLVLDPFAGTGTTGEAAWREHMKAVIIEREKGYQEDIRKRLHVIKEGGHARDVAKLARHKRTPIHLGTLFTEGEINGFTEGEINGDQPARANNQTRKHRARNLRA